MGNRPGLCVWDYSDSHGGRAGNLQSSNWPAARSALNLATDLWVSVAISLLRWVVLVLACLPTYLQQEYWLPGRHAAKLTFPLLWSLSLPLRTGGTRGIFHKKGSQEQEAMRIHIWRGWGREGSNRERKSQFPLPSTCLLETVYRDCLLLPLSAFRDRPYLSTSHKYQNCSYHRITVTESCNSEWASSFSAFKERTREDQGFAFSNSTLSLDSDLSDYCFACGSSSCSSGLVSQPITNLQAR